MPVCVCQVTNVAYLGSSQVQNPESQLVYEGWESFYEGNADVLSTVSDYHMTIST